MQNLWNSVLLSTLSVAIGAAARRARRLRFRALQVPVSSEDIAFTLLSFRFAPPLLVLLPLSLYFQEHRPDRHLYRPRSGSTS